MIFGMSALIVAFWFIAQGVALRYFVSEAQYHPLYTETCVGSIYRCHVVSLRSLGCHRRYHCTKSQCFRCLCICTCLRMLSFARYDCSLVYLFQKFAHNWIDSLGCHLACDRHNLFRSRSPRWSRSFQRIRSTTKGRCITFLTSAGFKIWSCFNNCTRRISNVNCVRTFGIPRIIDLVY